MLIVIENTVTMLAVYITDRHLGLKNKEGKRDERHKNEKIRQRTINPMCTIDMNEIITTTVRVS